MASAEAAWPLRFLLTDCALDGFEGDFCRTVGILETACHLFSRLCRFFIFQVESEFMRLYMDMSHYS